MEQQATVEQLRKLGQKRLTVAERRRRRRALDTLGVPEFEPFLEQRCAKPVGEPLLRGAVSTLQVNVGLYCNQACTCVIKPNGSDVSDWGVDSNIFYVNLTAGYISWVRTIIKFIMLLRTPSKFTIIK